MTEVKEWACEIEINFNHHGMEAETEEDFVELIKDFYREEYNLLLKDHEIKNIKQSLQKLKTKKKILKEEEETGLLSEKNIKS